MESPPIILDSARLRLVAFTLRHIEAELEHTSVLKELLGASVPAAWPPGEHDRDALHFFQAQLKAASPSDMAWFGFYAIASAPLFESPTLIGSGGFMGPPTPDGRVEIGYSLLPEARGYGLATEMVQGLVAYAFKRGAKRVIAHTTRSNPASMAVLLRCGFEEDGPGEGEGTIRFTFPRPVQNHRAGP